MPTTFVTLDVSADEQASKEDLAREVRPVWILDPLRRGWISLGRGAELVGPDRWLFIERMPERGNLLLAYPRESDQETRSSSISAHSGRWMRCS